jgi:hypothetical protein
MRSCLPVLSSELSCTLVRASHTHAAISCLSPPSPVQERRDGRAQLTRQSLLIDIEKKGLLALVPPEVKQIYGLLESDFNPLQLCKVVAPLLEALPALNQPVSGKRNRREAEAAAEAFPATSKAAAATHLNCLLTQSSLPPLPVCLPQPAALCRTCPWSPSLSRCSGWPWRAWCASSARSTPLCGCPP